MLERSLSLKVLGAAFIAMLVFFLWITYAFFTKAFVDYDTVTLKTDTTGVNLPQNADIKLRGVIVGEVRKVESDGAGVKLQLGMNPKLIKDVPKEVTAQLIPKTLFGEKYVALIPRRRAQRPVAQGRRHDHQGRRADRGRDSPQRPLPAARRGRPGQPLLHALGGLVGARGSRHAARRHAGPGQQPPAEDQPRRARAGRRPGQARQVSDVYAEAIPELGEFLRNTVTTGNTIVAKKSQLTAFFDEGTRALQQPDRVHEGQRSTTSRRWPRTAVPILETVGTYSTTFPCFLKAMNKLIPRLDSAYREGMLHINVEVIAQPDAYAKNENLVATNELFDEASTGAAAKNGKDIRADNAAVPSCLDLNEINKGNEAQFSSQAHPFTIPASVYKLIGVKSPHAKYGTASDFDEFNRPAAVSLSDLVQPSVEGIDSADERAELNVLLGARLGMQPTDVPDIGSLLVGPMLRGSGVSLS